MKFLVALMLPLIAIADEYPEAAGFQNNAGGWTVIANRDQYCKSKDMRDGYAFGADSKTVVRFCWMLQGERVMVVFEDGQTGFWSIKSFEYLSKEPEVGNNQP